MADPADFLRDRGLADQAAGTGTPDAPAPFVQYDAAAGGYVVTGPNEGPKDVVLIGEVPPDYAARLAALNLAADLMRSSGAHNQKQLRDLAESNHRFLMGLPDPEPAPAPGRANTFTDE